MTTNQDPFIDNYQGVPIPLPNSTLVLVLGIVSIPACCFYGVPGLICSIIALVLARNAKKTYLANPSMYTRSSYSNLNSGRVCSIITLILSLIFIVLIIIGIIVIGWAALTDPTIFQERYGIDLPI